MKVRTLFDRKRVSIDFDPAQKMTKEAFKDECDINNIMKKYLKSHGGLPMLMRQDAKYGDFSDVPTYQEAFDIVATAQEAFFALSADIRKECDNDPAVFLERVSDSDWAFKHGLTHTQLAAAAELTKGQPGAPVGSAATQPGEAHSSSSVSNSSSTKK